MASGWPLFVPQARRDSPAKQICPLTGNFSCEKHNRYPDCHNKYGMDFNTTQIITTLINCTDDWRIFKDENGKPNPYGLLSGAGCRSLAGDSFTPYPGLDIINRLSSWKLPLLQLVFLTPRPPLGAPVSFLVLLRLLGNPGGSIQDYITKIVSCYGRAKFWQAAFSEEGALGQLVGEPPEQSPSVELEETPQVTSATRLLPALRPGSPFSAGLLASAGSNETGKRDKNDDSENSENEGTHADNEHVEDVGDDHESNRSENDENDEIDGNENDESEQHDRTEARDLARRLNKFQRRERLWKAFAIITDSYDEWGRDMGDKVAQCLFTELKNSEVGGDAARELLEASLRIAGALAVDKTTMTLPMASAISIFLLSIGFTIFRTWAATPYTPGFYMNIEAYSLGFSALYFWIFSAEILAAIIGSSDSKDRIPSILNRLKVETGLEQLPNFELHGNDPYDTEKPGIRKRKLMDSYRKSRGGIYSWQPRTWATNSGELADIKEEALGTFKKLCPYRNDYTDSGKSQEPFRHRLKIWLREHVLFPQNPLFTLAILSTGLMSAFAICATVPPGGLNCRHKWLVITYGVWILSWLLDGNGLKTDSDDAEEFACFATISNIVKPIGRLSPLCWISDKLPKMPRWMTLSSARIQQRTPQQMVKEVDNLFQYHLIKDALSTMATIGSVVATQVGILNRCDCYTSANFGISKALHLPQMSPAAEILETRFNRLYPALFFPIMALNLIFFPGLVAWGYREAIQVFVQRDDGQSNYKGRQTSRFLRQAGKKLSRRRRKAVVRAATLRVEEGNPEQTPSELRKKQRSRWKLIASWIWWVIKRFCIYLREFGKAFLSIFTNLLRLVGLIRVQRSL